MIKVYTILLWLCILLVSRGWPQNVGVGTATPSSKLEIQGLSGDENSAGILRLSNTSGSTHLRIGTLDGSRSWIQSHASLPLHINRLGNNVILNETAGHVGIGVSSPSQKLHIGGNVRMDGISVEGNTSFRVYRNLATYNNTHPAAAGAFVIVTSQPWNSACMFRVKLEGYFYDPTASFEMSIGAYMFVNNDFYNYGYINTGSQSLQVRLGRHIPTNTIALIIGNEASSYSYPKITVTSFMQGHSNINENYANGWTISQMTNLSGIIDYIVTVPDLTRLNGLSAGDFIRNQFASAQTANFWISGIGRVPTLDIHDANTRITQGSGNSMQLTTNFGVLQIGPQNTAWSHFYTDRPRYYFNKGITVDEGLIGSYDEDLQLQTSGITRITVLNSNGFTGIGTTTPGQMLDVNGRIRLVNAQTELYQSGNRLLVRSENIDNVAQFASYGLFLPRTGQAYNLYVSKSMQLGYNESDPVISYRNGALLFSADATERMRLTAAGDLGIGKVPAYRLDVNAAGATTIGINTNGYAQDMSGRLARNLVSSFCWNVGTSSVGIFYANQTTATENEREWGEGPHGQRALLWKCVPSGDGNADGGWNSATFEIDHTKTYRVSVWVKKTGDHDGTTYLGVLDNHLVRTDGTPQGNPYFWCGDLPILDRWYLIVGYIYGSGDATNVSRGGIYDGVTGQKVVSFAGNTNCNCDYKFTTASTIQQHRAYLYYNGNSTNRQYFWDPRFEEVNGSEPTIQALLGNISALVGINGTTNYVSKFTSTTTLGNSQIFDNGTNVGVAVSNPAAKLHVSSSNMINNNGAPAGGLLWIGGKNNDFDHQYINFRNPSSADANGMFWWSSDVLFGRFKNEAFWSFKETHGGSLGSAIKDIMRAYITDAGGYQHLNRIVMAPDAGTVVVGNSSNLANKLQVAGSMSVYDDAQNSDSRYFGEVIERGWVPSIGSVSYATVSDAPVGNVVARATSYTWVYGPRIALDRTKDYLVEGWVRYTSGSPAVWYFCVQNYDANGNNLSGDGTDWHYPVSGATPPTTWTKFTFIVGPNGVKNHHANAKFISVGWIANYTSGNATYEFCGWRIRPLSPASFGGQSVASAVVTSETILTSNNTGTFSFTPGGAGWTPGTWQNTGFSVTKNITPGNMVHITVTARIEGDNYNYYTPSCAYFRLMRGSTELARTAVYLTPASTVPTNFWYYNSNTLSFNYVDTGVSGSQTYSIQYWLPNEFSQTEAVFFGERYMHVIELRQ